MINKYVLSFITGNFWRAIIIIFYIKLKIRNLHLQKLFFFILLSKTLFGLCYRFSIFEISFCLLVTITCSAWKYGICSVVHQLFSLFSTSLLITSVISVRVIKNLLDFPFFTSHNKSSLFFLIPSSNYHSKVLFFSPCLCLGWTFIISQLEHSDSLPINVTTAGLVLLWSVRQGANNIIILK